MAKRKQSSSSKREAALSKINYNVSGIDLGSEEMVIAVIGKKVLRFSTFTKGLEDAAESQNYQYYWDKNHERIPENGSLFNS